MSKGLDNILNVYLWNVRTTVNEVGLGERKLSSPLAAEFPVSRKAKTGFFFFTVVGFKYNKLVIHFLLSIFCPYCY